MELELGDYIEVHYKEFIRKYISNYELIWGQFIGHDGNGKMIAVNNLPENEQKQRTNFSEYLYTCLQSFICMNSICNSRLEVNLKNPTEYLSMLNQFMAFQAHAGRIRDNTTELLTVYFNKKTVAELMVNLNDTYQKRNNVLHGKKLPYRIEDSLVLIAPVKGESENSKDWDSGMNWSQFGSEDLVFLGDYLKSTLHEISKTFNIIIANLIKPIGDIVKKYDIKIERNNNSQLSDFNTSGVITFPASASIGFSGYSETFPYEIGKS